MNVIFCPSCCQPLAGLGISLNSCTHIIYSLCPQNVDKPMFLEGRTLYRTTSISFCWVNTSMGQSSYRTQGIFWPFLFFPCFCSLGTLPLLEPQGSKASTRAGFPSFSLHTPYSSLCFTFSSCLYFLFLPPCQSDCIHLSVLRYSSPPRRQGSPGWSSCLSNLCGLQPLIHSPIHI